MGKILQLPVHISNQIKAGEIVERPMSVVKELVENAIDANSTQIDVIIEEGGLSKIQVIDNGDGMEADDTLIAFERHATSKMTTLIEQSTILSPDKMPISTLGFRGEALSSIASVSKVTLETSTGTKEGAYVYLEGGQVIEQRASTARKGTSLTVEQLFFNTPARLKFISSLQTEVSKIADLLNRLALSHPTIAFSLTVDGNRLMKTIGNGQLKQTIAGIYSPTIAKQMIAIESENLRFKISGFTSLPELTRAKKTFISIFLNGRYIRNFLLINAVVDGYRSKLMIGRFPITVLNIQTDYRLVDVNAHPTKETVRISQEQELIQLIQQAISQAMDNNVRIPSSMPKRFEKTMVQDSLSFVSEDFSKGTTHTPIPTSESVLDKENSQLMEANTNTAEYDNAILEHPQNNDINQIKTSGRYHERDIIATDYNRVDNTHDATDYNQSVDYVDNGTNSNQIVKHEATTHNKVDNNQSVGHVDNVHDEINNNQAIELVNNINNASTSHSVKPVDNVHNQTDNTQTIEYENDTQHVADNIPFIDDTHTVHNKIDNNYAINHNDKSALQQYGKNSFDEGISNQTNAFPPLHYFGQMHGTYLFAENENGLYIVDQHAAQERIKYEYYRVKIGEVDGAMQQLLVPLILDYPINEFLLIKDKMTMLSNVGIQLQLFGQNSFIVEEHPTWIKDDAETVMRDLIQMALDLNKVDIAKYRENLAIMMSCKKSIKANYYLDDKQARQLLMDLSLCENPYNCPHGRPVLIHLSNTDMEKMFKRIQERN